MQEVKPTILPFYQELPAFFSRLELQNRVRSLDPPFGIDFCSNDYLGLSSHPEIIQSLKEGLDLYGAGSTASRLVRGHREIFERLENIFSDWIRSEASLFFANGYAANMGAISSIADSSYLAFCDRKNHASLMDGVRLSGARKIYYRHNDLEHLKELLEKHSGHRKKIIITESVFSMDGDRADIPKLVALKEEFGCLLYLDEAHAIGVLGEKGEGLAPFSLGKKIGKVDFRMSTLGKALGLEGAILSSSEEARKYIFHSARTFVFSTAPLPAIAYAGCEAVRLAIGMDRERKSIGELSDALRSQLSAKGLDTGNSSTQIVPILLESEEEALRIAKRLEEKGFQAKAIRPPTVDRSRIRVSIHSKISKEEVSGFVDTFSEN